VRIGSSLFLVSSSCPHEDIFDAADSYTKRLLPFWLVLAGSRDLGYVIDGRDCLHVMISTDLLKLLSLHRSMVLLDGRESSSTRVMLLPPYDYRLQHRP
jgi:hypothetical protein